ncbi:AsmA-like C-terminal region-containing protein [Chelativorans sp. AA-79]|uniref:AsmA family protein n=1 Tax=Chelativorans sp. AA-79 TaxID=3028735 RepID=UPI0023F9B125|nr:AsmA-like C-terminal region-containing protein [Chelativorans sp. AA-79]WEX08814.1 AsmA-like C-terminal region-containing protein [Chelativorans sp. AA-79]
MPVSLAKRGIWAITAIVVLVALVVAVLPLVASTQIVRDSIAYQMSAWSGYHVRLDDSPEIRVWPLQAVLNDVTLLDSGGADAQAVLDAERIEVDLSALAALRGDIVFTRMRLIRPVLRMRQEAGRLQPIAPQDWGKVPRSVEVAKHAVAAEPRNPDSTFLPSDPFGKVEFVEGRIVAGDEASQTDIVTSLSGTLDWPALNRQASLAATGIWRGESASIQASVAEPLFLFGGGSAALTFALEAAPASLSFEGVASLSGNGFLDGHVELSAPSLSRLAEWTHSRSPIANRIGPLAITARLVGDRNRLKFEDATLKFDTSTGQGLLDVNFEGGRPMIAGTLAFDTLNLRALVNTFSPLPTTSGGQNAPKADSEFDFDLRFSAASATYDKVVLTDVAAAAMMRAGLSSFDISDATAFGGMLQLGLRRDRTGADDAVEISMIGEDIALGELADSFDYRTLMPQAKGSFSLMLKGKGKDMDAVLQSADGSLSATIGKGSVPGLSIDGFVEHSAEGDFFPVSALGEGSLPIDDIQLKAVAAKGVVQLDALEAHSGPYTVGLDGFVPLAGRGLALYGTLSASEGADPRFKSPIPFFVGGSWNAPFIASFLPKPAEQ